MIYRKKILNFLLKVTHYKLLTEMIPSPRERGTSYSAQASLASQCRWDTSYSITSVSLECLVKFCDNATHTPNTDGKNYNIREGLKNSSSID